MEIALVRHGQTDYNRDSRLQGSSDIALNATGLEQARTAAQLLSDDRWDAVVSSPLQRAAVTADIIAEALEVEVLGRFPGLVERDYGAAEGLTKEQAVEKFGDTWPGQESFEDLQRRAVATIEEIATEHPLPGLVIVAHGTLIRAFTDHVTAIATDTPDNAHSVRLSGEPGDWKVVDGLLLR